MAKKSVYRLTLSYLNGYSIYECSVFHAFFGVNGYKIGVHYLSMFIFCERLVYLHQQYPNAYRQNSVPVRVVYLARCEVCGYPCNGFLFL